MMKKTTIALGLCLLLGTMLRGGEYDLADQRALSVGTEFASWEQLARVLTQDLGSQQEKARAIFRWVAEYIAYDEEEKVESKTIFMYSTEEEFERKLERHIKKGLNKVLKTRKTLPEGYAQVMKLMLNTVGIKAKVIQGYVRTNELSAGRIGRPSSWNIISFGEYDYLIDACSGAGYLDAQTKTFQKDFNDFYFMPDSALLIKTHYPLRKKDQLQTPPVERKEFTSQVFMYRDYFKHDIRLLEPTSSVLKRNDLKDLTIRLVGRIDSAAISIDNKKTLEEVSVTTQGNWVTISCGNLTKKKNLGSYLDLLINGDYVLRYRLY